MCVRSDEFEQAHPSVSSAVAAVLYAAPGRLRDAVRVDDFIDHHRSGFDALGQPPPAAMFLVHTLAVKPKTLSLASSMASSSVLKVITGNTGPNVSSRMIVMR